MAEASTIETAYVAVGSNVDPLANIVAAVRLLRRQVELTGVSTFYRTAALDGDGSPDEAVPEFLNGVLGLRTGLGPEALRRDVLRPIERGLGRARSADRFAPRTIDLDVVLYGERVVDGPGLTLPSPDLERAFVAVPLLELAPRLILPHTRQPLSCLWRGRPAGMAADIECTRRVREVLTE